ncbi:MAG: alpha/beta hydrolase [Bacteroidota bacterium]
MILLTVFLIALILGVLLIRAEKGTRLYEFKILLAFWYQLFTYKVKKMKEERYRYGEHWRQYFLLLKPDEDEKLKNQVILYFHGGGWRLGKPEFFRVHAQLFVKKGYTVIMPSHRRIPLYSYKHMREDLNLLMQKLDKVLEKEQIADRKIILGGASSGANLAAHLLYNRSELAGCSWSQARFSGIFLLAAPLDLTKMKSSLVTESYIGWQKEETIQIASPISYLEEDETTPVLCVHGEKDGIVEYATTLSFVEKIRKINPAIVQFHTLKGGTHLDVSRWGYRMDELQSILLTWLKQFE